MKLRRQGRPRPRHYGFLPFFLIKENGEMIHAEKLGVVTQIEGQNTIW